MTTPEQQPDTTTADTSSGDSESKAPPQSPKPPRGPALWIIATVVLVGIVAFAGGTFFGPAAIDTAQSAITSISGKSDESAHDDADGITNLFYTCGMHPWVILPDEGQCPICHMDLTPLDPDKFTGEISIDPVMAQNIGVRIQPVITGPVVRTIRTVGTITYDETRVRDISIKVPGWIESLFVDYEGIAVQAGQPLFEFYSPKLYSAQSEYLSVLSMRDRGPAGTSGELDTERLIDDARVQLEFYDITTDQIATLERAGVPTKTMPILSPFSGIVIAKHANEGMRVEPGMRVFQIADLTKVWVQVSLYEYQLPFLKEDQLAEMSLPYIPGQRFNGRVAYIYPYLDETNRQVTVRLEFDNPNGLLKPGMYASVELKSTLARNRTQAPRSAIIDTGERQVAFVSLGEGKFEPRDITMGVQTQGDMVEILDGLKPGEMVVTSGQFLLDSEARIREGLAKMIKGELAGEQTATVSVTGSTELTSLPEPMRTELTALMDGYLTISDALASDSTDSIATPARRIAAAVDTLLNVEIPGAPQFWQQHDEIATIRGKALELASASTLDDARLAFADISIALSTLTKATGVPVGFDSEVQELHCPMYRDGQGGSLWLQKAGAVRNPYFGSVMLECFDRRSALPTTGQNANPHADDPAILDGSHTSTEPASDETSGPTPAVQSAIDDLVSSYLAIQDALTRDDLKAAGTSLMGVHRALGLLPSDTGEPLATMIPQLHKVASLDTTSLESFRSGFRNLSTTMIELVRIAPPSEAVASTIYRAYCPMKKADWLQTSKDIANPYSSSMSSCGSIKEEFAAHSTTGGTP